MDLQPDLVRLCKLAAEFPNPLVDGVTPSPPAVSDIGEKAAFGGRAVTMR